MSIAKCGSKRKMAECIYDEVLADKMKKRRVKGPFVIVSDRGHKFYMELEKVQ